MVLVPLTIHDVATSYCDGEPQFEVLLQLNDIQPTVSFHAHPEKTPVDGLMTTRYVGLDGQIHEVPVHVDPPPDEFPQNEIQPYLSFHAHPARFPLPSLLIP